MWGCVAALTMCFVKPAPANDAGNTPATASTLTSAQVPYGVATWPEEGRGNHRALLRVDSPADAVRAHIEWRRRDQRPETKDVRVYDADTGKRVTNVVVRYLTQEAGDLAFQPATAPGNYEVYYLPYNGPKANFDDAGTYFPPKLTAEADWLKRNRLSPEAGSEAWQALSAARVVAIQARGERHRMDPMEVIATPEEITHLLGQHPRASYLVFPEDREHAIRMFETLPWRWVRSGPGTQFKGKAQPGEYYPFQLGVWAARQAITNMAVEFRDLHGSSGATIPAARLTCFNTAGTNCLGEPMHPVFAVGQGMVRALWIGIDVPVSAKGRYTGEIRLKPFGGSPTTVKVILDIDGVALADGGVSDLERLSRLKWLNSQLGMEETVIPPFTPVEAVERTVRILNREIRFNSRGLPESIVSNRREILAGPVTLVAETVAGKDALLSGKRNRTRIIKQTPATVERVTELAGDAIRCSLQSTTEFDGCILFRAILTATKPVDLKDVRLEVPVQRDVARYMMGMVKRGGLRTEKEWHWKWNIDRADNQIWLGDFDAGLQVHLRGSKDTWDLVNLRDAGLPSSWHNGGKGGCAIVETGDAVVVRAYSGPRKIDAGQTCEFVFRFLVTPFKPIDARHWNWRCGDVDGAGNIVHIHHGAPPNSYINYPFIQGRELAAAIQQIRSKPKRTSPGSLSYAAEGNLDLRRGSLHVWVTLGFDPAKGEPRHAEYNQLLFTLELPNGDGLGFYWNIDVRGLRAYVHKVSPTIDVAKLRSWKESILSRLSSGIGQLAKMRGVQVMQGRGYFEDSRTLRVETGQGQQFIQYDHAIIAVGSKPAMPRDFDLGNPRVMTSTEALEMEEIPENLLVIGGGYIGMELGTVYATFGSKVVLVEALDSILAGADPDLARPVVAYARKAFKEVRLKTKVGKMATSGKQIKVEFNVDGQKREELYDRVLIAVGRSPNADDLGLENTKVSFDEKGFIHVNEKQQTTDSAIYAIGDIAGGVLLAHKATKEGRIAVEVIAGQDSAFVDVTIPAVVFTDPELAWCGLTESDAKAKGIDIAVAKFPWAASGRALSFDHPEGLTKLIIDPHSERILGVGIVGYGAGELIAEGVLAVEMGATAKDLALTVHPHPTLSETLMEAAEAFYGHATHTLVRKKAG